MYAIIKTGGKQYRVEKGDVISVEKLDAKEGDKVVFEDVIAMGEGADIKIGTPFLEENVYGEVVENGKGKKVIIYKYKAKKDSRKKQGHRQPFTKVEITGLGTDDPKSPAKAEAPAQDATDEAPKAAKEEPKASEDSGVNMSMKKDELIAYAEEHGIEIKKSDTKQQIIDTINASK